MKRKIKKQNKNRPNGKNDAAWVNYLRRNSYVPRFRLIPITFGVDSKGRRKLIDVVQRTPSGTIIHHVRNLWDRSIPVV